MWYGLKYASSKIQYEVNIHFCYFGHNSITFRFSSIVGNSSMKIILFWEESLDMIFITYKLLRKKVPMMVQMIKQIGQNINISSLVKRYARVICIIFAIFLNSNFFSNKKQSSTQADTCTLTFTVILFTLAKRQEKSKHLETDE